ncbi:hypothetical protein A7J57_23555 [Agrobacterium tumefaciens]|uniref:Uncharacterized protein n=1 Tax=Agrobacterium tumefaciens TaxID=358 RepID=A0A176WZG3_AGRTU|nr:hypothetical protein A7J57_23555 [Agrobacterium tumefaciens]
MLLFLLPGGEKKPAATSRRNEPGYDLQPMKPTMSPSRAFLIGLRPGVSVLLTLFVKIVESTMKCVGARMSMKRL